MQQAIFCDAAEFIAGDAFDGSWRPISADVSKNLCGIGEKVAKKHRNTIQTVVFCSHHVGGAFAIPVKRGRENRFEKVPIRAIIRPLALSLEACGDGIVALSFFSIAHFSKAMVTHHHVAGDECHFDRNFPFAIELHARACGFGRVVIFAFWAMIAHPREGFGIFLLIENVVIDATQELGHVYGLNAHAEVFFEKCLIDDRTSDAH